MNALARASKQALQTAARGFASGAYPDRKVAVLGAAGEHRWSAVLRCAAAAVDSLPCRGPAGSRAV